MDQPTNNMGQGAPAGSSQLYAAFGVLAVVLVALIGGTFLMLQKGDEAPVPTPAPVAVAPTKEELFAKCMQDANEAMIIEKMRIYRGAMQDVTCIATVEGSLRATSTAGEFAFYKTLFPNATMEEFGERRGRCIQDFTYWAAPVNNPEFAAIDKQFAASRAACKEQNTPDVVVTTTAVGDAAVVPPSITAEDPMASRDAQRISDIQNLQLGCELYFDSFQKYPTSIADIVTNNFVPGMPHDPLDGSEYFFKHALVDGSESYMLGASLEQVAPVLQTDADVIQKSDNVGCKGETGRHCFDIRP